MVQQAASEKASVPPLQGRVAADPDFGLVPDLIAAADFLKLSEFLPAGSEPPLELDTPWVPPTPLSTVIVAEFASFDALLASLPTSPVVSSSPAAPAAPVPLPLPLLAAPPSLSAPSPVAYYCAASPAAGLIDAGAADDRKDWEQDDDTEPSPLPIGSVRRRRSSSVLPYQHRLRTILRLAEVCYGLGRPGLSNTGLWERFYQQQGKTFDDGVVARDTNSFFNFIRAEKVLLEYVELFKVYQNVSMPSAALMEKSARSLPSGYYIVYAADGLVKHCFTSIGRGPSDPAIIYNGYRESDNPPILLEPLTILG
ncbi:hypothetical protein GN958_ATG05832 [Phytophthora infestans]|uniref:Uncharacterized protein n=1 Tax=Phytophthora infestans TaxID=4787 RepID=A0A8S9UU47_PHYIN|nr:hypothetical protein GN958_ATG08195 [Phytophthora infestans]KAF4145001.1 hypothetical protein GN958_ATG05832 [Phytophthora infestans]